MKRVCVFLLLVCLAAAVAVLGISSWVCASSAGYILEDAASVEDADCILVLGCGVRPDGQPSLMLRDRLDAGLKLYQAGAAPKLLMSGDHREASYDEVNAMKNYALAAGVPSEDIFTDHAGLSTYESMYRARDIFCAKKIIIVSQGYHLYRAVYDARALGLDAWGVAAENIRYSGQLARGLREILARNKDFLYCIFQPEPTYLGDAIPISGDGNLSAG